MNATAPAVDLLVVENISKHFHIRGKFLRPPYTVRALNGVSLTMRAGEVFCVVGESGCGKSTLARVIAGLHAPTAGRVHVNGMRVDNLSAKARRPFRRELQMIFQNPQASLNPRMTVAQTLEEVLRFHFPAMTGDERREKMETALRETGLAADALHRYPHQFSGGQRQRISIARALIVQPLCIIADEPVAALDVSVRAQILNVLTDLSVHHRLAYFFITHDLSVVENFADRVAVMYAGNLVETADCQRLFEAPKHPYSKILLQAAPKIDKPLTTEKMPGEPPSLLDVTGGCAFHPRCPLAGERCRRETPALVGDKTHAVACHAINP